MYFPCAAEGTEIQMQNYGDTGVDKNDDDVLLREEELPQNFDTNQIATDQQSFTYYAAMYDGKIVYIETYRWRGRWLDTSYSSGWAYFKSVPEEDVVDHLGVKWKVKNIGGGEIVLESLQFKRHYLDAHHTGWCKVTQSSYPQDKNWARFKIGKKNGRFFFQSVRYPSYHLQAYYSLIYHYWAAITTEWDVSAEFRIYIPPKDSYYQEVFSYDNRGNKKGIKVEYAEKLGISITNGQEISTTVSVEIGGEIKSALSVGVEFSNTWKTFSQSTYSKETTHTVTAEVGPGKLLKVLQLVGKYGHYFVRAKRFKFESTNMQATTQVTFASGMEEYNRGELQEHNPELQEWPDSNAGPPVLGK